MAGAGKDLCGGHALNPAAVHVVETAFYCVSPRRFNFGGEADRPQLGVQPFGDLLPGLARESADFGLDLLNGIHPAGDNVVFPAAGNCVEGWQRAYDRELQSVFISCPRLARLAHCLSHQGKRYDMTPAMGTLVAWMETRTQASNRWLADKVHLGTPAALSRNLTRY